MENTENIEKETMLQDRDFKYILQDTGAIYVGARYSYGELLEEEPRRDSMSNNTKALALTALSHTPAHST